MASLAYLAWPIAIWDRVAPRGQASRWYRFHLHQALWFGNVAGLVALVALVWPMLAGFFVTSVTVTLWMYGLAMLLDIALFCSWLVLALRYSRRAAQGERFEVPWIVRLTGSRSQKT